MNVRGITWESGLKISREKIYLKWEGGEEREGGEQTPGERDKTERWWQEEVKRKLSIQPNSGETVTTWNRLIMHTRSAESWIMLQGWIDIYGSPEGPSGKRFCGDLNCFSSVSVTWELVRKSSARIIFHFFSTCEIWKKEKKNQQKKIFFVIFFKIKQRFFTFSQK